MRTLLRFIQRYSNLLLFLLLEILAISWMVSGTGYQRSKIVSLTRQVSGSLFSWVDGTREYLSLRHVNQELARENTELRNRIEIYDRLMDSARVVITSADSMQYHFVPARVVRNSVYKQYNYITIDRGKDQGVYRNMGVISDMGLVGIVQETSGNYATVIPVINRDFRLSVMIQSTEYAGILQWNGESPVYADLAEIPFHVELTEGDTIITSGFSAIFPAGIHVGQIESFSLDRGNFYRIRVRLSTDFQRLFHVNVIRNYRQQEQLDLESRSQ
ncbi:MAG: rod shape-determining protein MreC [Bacteroidetes bacterium]|nr:MAG: rod shape-determining protein MreC [Bacteroidota bacterium]